MQKKRIKKAIFLTAAAAGIALAICNPSLMKNSSALEGTAFSQEISTSAGAEPQIYFKENFRNYRDTAPTCVDDAGITIGNDPIWSQSAEANINMAKSGFVLKDFSPSPQAAPGLINYDVLFKFQLKGDPDPGHFELHLRNSLQGKTGEVIVGISSNDIQISSDGINPAVTSETKLPFEIDKNEWHTAAVTVRHGELSVFIDDDRVIKPITQVKVPAAPSAGVNFYGFKESPFSITDIVVRDPSALPDHTITNILPALPQIDAAAFKSGVSETVPASDIFGATIRTGLEKDAVKMTINWSDGKTNDITFDSVNMPDERKTKKDGKHVTEKIEYPDAIIQIKGIGGVKSQLDDHIRPLLRRYKSSYSVTDTYRDIIRDWDLLPKASEHSLKVELRRTVDGVDIYFDGSYAGSISGATVKNIVFTLSPTASIGYPFSLKREYDPQKYFPLDIAAHGMAKSFVNARTSLNAGLEKVKNIPLFVTSGAGSADIGLTREGQGNWALEVDEYLARSPFDGFLSEVHYTVPGGIPYTKAWVLCAVDPDPAKDPILTTRITHYVENGIGGNLIADTTITLPRGDEKPGDGVTLVGTVSKTDQNGKKVEVPLYLVEVPLKSGKILDQFKNSSMDFEFFGKPWKNFEQIDNSMKPDPHSTSAVQVFGATLEKSPVGMDLVQSQPGNIFANDETPETTAVINSFVPAKGKLLWDIYDVDGKKVKDGSANYNFAKAGEEQKITLPLKMPELGWYRLMISAQDQNGNTLFTHPASFALLGQDLRKAKYDSPYATWWFDGAHNTPKELDFAGPIMFKAGIRNASWTGHTEAEMAKWFITKPQVNLPFKFGDLQNPENILKNAEAAINKALQAYPHLREVLVFHESGPGNDVPMELIGLKPDNQTPDRVAYEKRYADLLNIVGPLLRTKFPQLKIVVGNNSSSAANIAAILRHGGNPDYIDYIGIEAPSQVFIPEKLQEWALQGMHIATDTAKVLSGRDIPATGCYEFTYRAERDMGQKEQAEWYSRDVLISLANKFTTISPGILFDTSNAYYNGLWGGSGMLERAPYGYPKKSYVAYATLTNVLDQVKFRSQIPTGSPTVYAVEFDRADKKLATALWASRGDADFNITFSGDTPVKVVDMYGRTREMNTSGGKLTVNAGVRPVYIVAEKEIKAITLSNRSFPEDKARAELSTVAAPLDNVDNVTLDKDNSLDTPKVFPLQLPIRQLGDFDLRQVQDDQKANCLELQLNTSKNPDLNKYITEYTTIRFKNPAPVSGNPAALGVWVKGNSNWGRVMFEIEDAKGEIWRSIGTGGWGCDVLDWPGHLSVNFDGWNFVALPLRDSTLFRDHSPGTVLEQWVSSGGDKKMEYPIKIRALMVEMNRKPLDLIDFKTVDPVIRLKDVSGIYEK